MSCVFRLLADLLGLLLELLDLLLGVLASLGTIRLDLYSLLANALITVFFHLPEGGKCNLQRSRCHWQAAPPSVACRPSSC